MRIKWGGLAAALFMAVAPVTRADIVGVQNVSTTVDANGNRAFVSTGFVGSADVLTQAAAGVFADGKLTYGSSAYNWNDLVPRDMAPNQNVYPGNPDRADQSSPYAAEAQNKGRLSEVFGVNNLSHIIDGEDDGAWTIDLFFPLGQTLVSDGQNKTPEIVIFERGGNSSLGVKGITVSGGVYSYTSGFVLQPGNFTNAGWNLNTIEISEGQPVVGVGFDLNHLGSVANGIVGLRVYSAPTFSGPDIVGIRTAETIPEPATLGLLGSSALLAFVSRRRRAEFPDPM